MHKAKWGIDYDMTTDNLYKRPICTACMEDAPITKRHNMYVCMNCGKEAELDAEMKAWIDKRSESKIKKTRCLNCMKKTAETIFARNKVTLKWQVAYGVCRNCGSRFIV